MLFWTTHFSILDSTFFVLDSTFWLESTLKIDPAMTKSAKTTRCYGNQVIYRLNFMQRQNHIT